MRSAEEQYFRVDVTLKGVRLPDAQSVILHVKDAASAAAPPAPGPAIPAPMAELMKVLPCFPLAVNAPEPQSCILDCGSLEALVRNCTAASNAAR